MSCECSITNSMSPFVNRGSDHRPTDTHTRHIKALDRKAYLSHNAGPEGSPSSETQTSMARSFTETEERGPRSIGLSGRSPLNDNLTTEQVATKIVTCCGDDQNDSISIGVDSWQEQPYSRYSLEAENQTPSDYESSRAQSDEHSPLLSGAASTQKAQLGQNSLVSMEKDVGRSTFIQSIFNSVNVLVGTGILAMPLGLAVKAGWIIGISVFVFTFGLTNYTAKLLAQCLDRLPGSRTYGDMGAAAFGTRGRVLVSCLFLVELVALSVSLVVLLCDGIDALFPGYSPIATRMLAFVILTPMTFVPIRHLSYTSLLGIFIAFSVLSVILIDGLSKPDAPGSLHEPADTTLWPLDWWSVPVSFGLLMCGFAGHSVFPTIYRDMKQPGRYNAVVNWSYATIAIVYFMIMATGYAMFGSQTMQEITQNLLGVPEYNQTINRLLGWLIALNPVAKYALSLSPINLSWEMALFDSSTASAWCANGDWRSRVMIPIGKIVSSACIVVLAYAFPEFDKIMSLLGAFFAFLISGIFPVVCHFKLFGETMSSSRKLVAFTLVGVSLLMGITGTIRSFV